jgi:hypothetical protein
MYSRKMHLPKALVDASRMEAWRMHAASRRPFDLVKRSQGAMFPWRTRKSG